MNRFKKEEKIKKEQKVLLGWILREWDFYNLEEAIQKSQTDYGLHFQLRKCGIQLEPFGGSKNV